MAKREPDPVRVTVTLHAPSGDVEIKGKIDHDGWMYHATVNSQSVTLDIDLEPGQASKVGMVTDLVGVSR